MSTKSVFMLPAHKLVRQLQRVQLLFSAGVHQTCDNAEYAQHRIKDPAKQKKDIDCHNFNSSFEYHYCKLNLSLLVSYAQIAIAKVPTTIRINPASAFLLNFSLKTK